ncbi:MAG: hypothetical protein FWG44_03725 [Oscillospiraceae bacterium]|nr:hypothetical protein [Oscillospiraceae bacterium]
MTKDEFNSYQRSIALQVLLADKGKITQKDMSTAIKIILGKEIFEEVEAGLNEE